MQARDSRRDRVSGDNHGDSFHDDGQPINGQFAAALGSPASAAANLQASLAAALQGGQLSLGQVSYMTCDLFAACFSLK